MDAPSLLLRRHRCSIHAVRARPPGRPGARGALNMAGAALAERARAQPVGAKLAGGSCDFQLGLDRGVVVPDAGTDAVAVAPGDTQVVIPVDAAAPDGLRPVTFPASVKRGQYVCVVAVPGGS